MIQDHEINREVFLAQIDLTKLKSGEIKYLEKACEHVLREKIVVGCVADPGSGAELAFKLLAQNWPQQIFRVECTASQIEVIYGDLMSKMPFHSSILNWYKTPYMKIIEAISYYLREINNRSLFIFDNCDRLSKEKFTELLNSFLPLRPNVGIIFRLSLATSEKYRKTTDIMLRRVLLQTDDWAEIKMPTQEELVSYCVTAGIIADTVIHQLVKDKPDYDVLEFRINKLKTDYLNHNNKKP